MGLLCSSLGCYVPEKRAVEVAIDLTNTIDMEKLMQPIINIDTGFLNRPVNITSLIDEVLSVKTIVLSEFLRETFKEKVARYLSYKSDSFINLTISQQIYITENIKHGFLAWLFGTKYEVRAYRIGHASLGYYDSNINAIQLAVGNDEKIIQMNFAKHFYQKINTFDIHSILQKCYDYIFVSRLSVRQLSISPVA